MDLELDGHVALVTGGARGIGRAVAEAFAREGCQVAVWDIRAEVGEVADQIAARSGRPVAGWAVDVSDYPAVLQARDQAIARLGPIDHLVHCAAVGSGKYGFPFTNLQPSDWIRVWEVNVMGMVHLAHAMADHMVPRRKGTMVFLSSVAGQIGSQTDPPYSAAKAANINFMQCVARDLAAAGIRVNALCPGMVRTALNRSVWEAWRRLQPPSVQQSYEVWAGEKIRRLVPLGTWQTPSDIADMAVFLSSARAAQVTGQTINVDGGFVMH